MAKRKFDRCQRCGNDFTDEHHFRKFCKKCQAEIEEASNKKPDKLVITPVLLDPENIDMRVKDINMGITCPKCNKSIDVSSKMQDWEIRCTDCKLLFDIQVVVEVKPL